MEVSKPHCRDVKHVPFQVFYRTSMHFESVRQDLGLGKSLLRSRVRGRGASLPCVDLWVWGPTRVRCGVTKQVSFHRSSKNELR